MRAFEITNSQLLGMEYAILRFIGKYNEYKNGVRQESFAGSTVSVIAPANDMEVIDVKLPGIFDIDITNEALMESAKKMEFVLVSFEGLTATPYAREGRAAMSYKAKGIQLVDLGKLVPADDKGKA